MVIYKEQLKNFDTRYRAHLVNSLSGFKSANLIGTKDQSGQTNLAIVSSAFHLGSHPALIGLIIRPHSVPRHTFENIKATNCFTINHVSSEIYIRAHQTSARYGKHISEFKECDLEEQYLDDFYAPFVAQSQLKYSVNLIEHQHLTVNETELIIGEVENIYLGDNLINDDGYIDIEAIDTVAVSGLDSYHRTERLSRQAYAKPDAGTK